MLNAFGVFYLDDIVATENATCVSSVPVLPNCALHLWPKKTNKHSSHSQSRRVHDTAKSSKCLCLYLFFNRLKLFIIHGQVDQNCALIGAVERQVWVGTCAYR